MRPFELLPLPHPREYDPAEKDPLYFYRNFASKFIPDMIRMMDVGITINDDAVEDLRKTIDKVLESVQKRLEANPLIKEYQNRRLPEAQAQHAKSATAALRDQKYYERPYKAGDMVHRTWVVNYHLERIGKHSDKKEKWSLKDLKQYNIFLDDAFLSAIIANRHLKRNKRVQDAMVKLAEYKLDLWNRPRLEKAKQPVDLPDFNPGSSKQTKEFFEMVDIAPLEFSKDTGEASWGRDQIEEVLSTATDPDLIDVLEAMVDFSYSAIIKNNFLKAFDSYTVDGVLHGNIKLFGAKSFRPTSNSPNLLNAPSSKSIYAKPLKKCFIAPEGKIIYTADLAALEDRVLANLSDDINKKNVFQEDLDGHSLNACGYYPAEIAEIMGPMKDKIAYIKEFYALSETNPLIRKLRTRSKAPTFKLAYGGYPDADRGGVITQEVFDNYHDVLYPGVKKYSQEYVLATAKEKGYIHLGLGCRMYSDKPDQAIRTLHNGTIQFWSILTLIAINEMHYRIDKEKLQNEVQISSTIYDSVYTQVTKDADILAWVNENLIEVLTVPYLDPEEIHNEAEGEIGYNWAELHRVPNNAIPSEIDNILREIDNA